MKDLLMYPGESVRIIPKMMLVIFFSFFSITKQLANFIKFKILPCYRHLGVIINYSLIDSHIILGLHSEPVGVDLSLMQTLQFFCGAALNSSTHKQDARPISAPCEEGKIL